MKKKLLFAGLDVHAKNITIALAEGGAARLACTDPAFDDFPRLRERWTCGLRRPAP